MEMEKTKLERMQDSMVERINRHIENEVLEHGPDWTKSWYQFSLAWAHVECSYIVIPPERLPGFVAKAKESSEVFDLAMFVSGTRLRCGVSIPGDLLELVSDYLMGKASRPPLGRGRPSKNTWGRDFVLIDVMSYFEMTTDHPLTQNRERGASRNHQVSISEIVERAVRISKLPNLSRIQIEKIWGNREKRSEYEKACELETYVDLDDANEIVRI